MKDSPKEIIWKTAEFKYYPKGASWYWLSFLITALLIIFAVWQKNFLFAFFIIIAEAALISWAKRTPRLLEFKIDKKGIAIGDLKFYSYEELAGFHIQEDLASGSELIFRSKNKWRPYIKISILDKDIPDIKKLLKDFLAEIEYEESFIDSLAKIIGF